MNNNNKNLKSFDADLLKKSKLWRRETKRERDRERVRNNG